MEVIRVLSAIYVLIISISSVAFAAGSDESEFDFSWLDPEKKIYVIQNRKFTKKGKLEPAIGLGFASGNPYRDSSVITGRLSYFLNERWGASIIGGVQSNSENESFTNLGAVSNTIPNIRDTVSFFGATGQWIPFYGKFNIFNQIFYVDWHVEMGAASVTSEVDLNFTANGTANLLAETDTGLIFGTGMKFFINRNFSARLEFLGLFYSGTLYQRGVVQSDTESNNTYYVTLGLSYAL